MQVNPIISLHLKNVIIPQWSVYVHAVLFYIESKGQDILVPSDTFKPV